MSKKDTKPAPRQIAKNRKATHEYFIEERFEAGLSLEGWEVKSLRIGARQAREREGPRLVAPEATCDEGPLR